MLRKNSLKFLACLMMLAGSLGLVGADPYDTTCVKDAAQDLLDKRQYELDSKNWPKKQAKNIGGDIKKNLGIALGMAICAGLRRSGVNPRGRTWGSLFLEKIMPELIGAITGNLDCGNDSMASEINRVSPAVPLAFSWATGLPKAFCVGHEHGKTFSAIDRANGNLSWLEAFVAYTAIFCLKQSKNVVMSSKNPFNSFCSAVAPCLDDEDLIVKFSYNRQNAFIGFLIFNFVRVTLDMVFSTSSLSKAVGKGDAMTKDCLKAVLVPVIFKLLIDCKPLVKCVKKLCLKSSEIEAERCIEQLAPGQMPVAPDCLEEPVVGKTSRRPSKKSVELKPAAVVA